MGTIKKTVVLDDEDILNLKNAENILANSSTTDVICEVATLQSIIKRWNNAITESNQVEDHEFIEEETRTVHESYEKEIAIEVELTSAQFAEMVTDIGVGEGIPCTLRCIYGNKLQCIEDPSEEYLWKMEKGRILLTKRN